MYFFSFRSQFFCYICYFAWEILSVHMWKNYLQKSQVCSAPVPVPIPIPGQQSFSGGWGERCWTFLNDGCKLYADHITLAPADGMCNCRLPLWIALHLAALPLGIPSSHTPAFTRKIERFIS